PRSTISPGAAVRAAPQSMQRVSTYQSPGAFWGCRLRINRPPIPQDEAIRMIPPRERSVLSSVLKLWNESRTNRARIADSTLSEFVHGDIWWHGLSTPQNRVRGRQSRSRPILKSINGDPPAEIRRIVVGRRTALVPDPNYCVFAVALLGCGMETNCVACMTPSPSGVGTAAR